MTIELTMAEAMIVRVALVIESQKQFNNPATVRGIIAKLDKAAKEYDSSMGDLLERASLGLPTGQTIEERMAENL